MPGRGVLVVIPHSGIVIPSEIATDDLSEEFPALVQNVDWYTNWLYDFRDILHNRHLVFPYCSIILEANRSPDILDDSVPVRDVKGRPIYREGRAPSMEVRGHMAEKYLKTFHQDIDRHIEVGTTFLFDGHSTVSASGIDENQIELMNFQHSRLDDGPVYFSPDIYVETYAEELRKRLPEVRITVNSSEYYKVYGHVCTAHSANQFRRVGSRVPALIQETHERLYKNADRTPCVKAINRLRRVFAESLAETLGRVREHDNRAG